MSDARIVLTGATGQVGWELQRALGPLGEVVAAGREQLDLADPQGLRKRLHELQPAVIVNAAAYTAVDRAESETKLAEVVNAAAPAVLAEEAAACGAWLVHYSTDYVFEGSGTSPRAETDPVGPASVYGRTKLAGEQSVLASGCAGLVFRTSWVFGVHGGNFLKTMLRAAATRDELAVVADQYGTPTPAHLIADVTAHAVRDVIAGRLPRRAELYHLAPRGETTWHDYAEYAIGYARELGWPVRARSIRPIATKDWPTPATRPANSRLDCRKLEGRFGLRLPDWQSGVRRVTQQLVEERISP